MAANALLCGAKIFRVILAHRYVVAKMFLSCSGCLLVSLIFCYLTYD